MKTTGKMTRRELFEGMGALTLAAGMRPLAEAAVVPSAPPQKGTSPLQLAGTEPFTMVGDIPAHMVAGIHADLIQRNTASIEARQKLWTRDFSNGKNYEASVAANRERFAKV